MAAKRPVQSHHPASVQLEREVQHHIHVRSHDPPLAAAVWEIQQVAGRGEREIMRLAGLQRSLAVREQLLGAGLGRGAIVHRLATGRMREVYRGVYLVGPGEVDPLVRELAAVLYFRGHAILSHRSAAVVWGLLGRGPHDDVSLTTVKARRSRPELRLHRVKFLHRRDLRLRDGLPLTAPARTLLDLAAEEPDADLEEALAVARQRGLASDDEIRAAIARAPRRKGAYRLARLLDTGHSSGFTRSTAERQMRALLRAAELPQPRANVPLLGYVADFLWAQHRLIVEVDGYLFHSDRASFESDRRRDQVFAAAGYTVIRVTWTQLLNEPLAVVARVAQALAARAA